ncbi:MAG: aldehyde dehydrogenase family protein [Alphaproteobacteria bacterium]|nr:MAG: aldehyde dehydrogenase family protein [Alphaproteobacteria bacterium]
MPDNLKKLAQKALKAGRIVDLPKDHFINGRFLSSQSGEEMESIDPGTGKAFHSFAKGAKADVDLAVAAARNALKGPWIQISPAERSRILWRASQLILQNIDRLAVAETLDSGKPVNESVGDTRGAARAFEYYAGAADKLQGDVFPLPAGYHGYSLHEPIGVTAHIIPWNFPISTTARGVAPALAAGCTIVAKPAEQTPLTALMLADILRQAGLPDGVFNVVTGTGAEAGAPLVAHPDIDHVTFTGSVSTGITVAKSAADNVTRLLLELGGKSPVTVLADCDLEAALQGVMGAIFENAGQICSASSRLVIERSIHAEFMEKLVQRTEALSIGHGLTDPNIGPVNSAEQQDKIVAYLQDAKARGLDILTGGHALKDPDIGTGWFVAPTIIDNLKPDDRICQEEIFGPVLAVQVVDDFDEAVAVANDTAFGLVAGIYTGSMSKAHRYARDIDAGQVYINEYFAGGIEVPFGGNKSSGYGREKGLEALKSYSKLKSVAAKI